ncbi:MAG: histidine kinase [Crocinitomicaceae bacterium]|nr:histidine kinase [Crocinitomicaceae bacterium]MBP6033014.1 histidine kinase [Crocinitomicaceae bacterium]
MCVLFVFSNVAQGNLKSLNQLKNQLADAKTITEQLDAKIELIDLYEQVDPRKWKTSILELHSIRKRYPKGESQQKIDIIFAEYLFKSGNIQRFKLVFYTKLSTIVAQSRDVLFRLNRIRFEYELASQKWQQARLTADSSLRLLRKNRNNARSSLIYQDVSRLYMSMSMRDSAFWASDRAISFAKRSQKREVLVQALQNQARNYGYFLDLESAVQKELQAIRLAEELHVDHFKIHSFIEIALYSSYVGNWTEALGYLKRALQLAREFHDDRSIAIIELNFSKVYLHQGQVTLAFYHVRKSQRSFLQEKDLYHGAQCAHSIGNIAAVKGDIALAKTSYEQAISFFDSEKMESELAEVYQDYGQLCIQIGDLAKAKYYLELSVKSDNIVHSIRLIDRYKLLSMLSMRNGDLRNALKFQNDYIQFLESNSIKRNDSKIAELTSSNLREERERLIEVQQRRIEKEKKEQEILKLQNDRVLYISLIIIFAIVFSLVILILRMKQVRSRQEQREAELSQTLLRTQMNPHFVFNAMSVIQSYIYENNPEKSSQFLVNFSRLMRLILENSPKEFIPIELELEILDKYLSTQKMRFENRFSYVLNVSEDLLFNKAIVPPMITQPFIENAIEHGQLHTVKGGEIIVEMKEVGGKLEISISDNGVGRKKSAQTKKIRTHKSMAIDITRERIEILNKKYKFNGSLTFKDLDDEKEQGTLVVIVLPLKYDTENF